MDLIELLHLLALSGYLGGWAALLRAFREGGGELEAVGWRVAVGGAGVHLAGLAAYAVVHGSLPLVGLGPASSTLAFLIVLLALGAAAREDVRPTALFVLPMGLLLLGEAVAVGLVPSGVQSAFRGPWFVIHVSTAFLGYAGLALASAAAAMYVLQFRSLKRKRFGSVFRFFPSLDTLDGVHRVGLVLGLSALTAGLVAGWSWTLTYGRGLALEDPQVIIGVVTWVLYVGAAVVRYVPGPREERSAVASTVAFLLTAVMFGALRLAGSGSGSFL